MSAATWMAQEADWSDETAASGVDRVFADVYDMDHEALFRWTRTLTRDTAVAEEIAQEAYVRLLREMRAGRCPDNVGAWLYRVAGNLATSHARHVRVAERRLARLAPVETADSIESVVIGRERARELASAFRRLPDDQRKIISLAARGLPGEEIARRAGVSPGASRTRLHRARARLRVELAR